MKTHTTAKAWSSAERYVSAWMGREFVGEDTCMWMTESLHCSPQTTRTLLISYTPTQNLKFERKQKYCFVTYFYFS